MIRWALACVVVVSAISVVHGQVQPSPMRVETSVAMEQIVKRVEPDFPPAIVAANPGAPFAADVIIKADGTVESVTILVGPAALHAPAVAALKQWTFKPFVNGGRAVRAITIVSIKLPDPVADADRRTAAAFFAALPLCTESAAAQSGEALTRCAESARLAETLSAERGLEKSHAFSMYGLSLLRANRPAEALVQFERALTARSPRAGDSDGDSASLLQIIGETHVRLGNLQRADESYLRATRMFERAIAALPSFRANYTERLRAALLAHAKVKLALGQPSEARALEARAASMK